MAKTIIQTIGPLYGEVVNGTVFGRPNGSVYVPSTNTISIDIPNPKTLERLSNGAYKVTGTLQVVAESQDIASNIVLSVFEDSDLTTQLGDSRSLPAGNFNGSWSYISYGNTEIVADHTYYVVAYLMNNGVPVATSSIVEVVGI